MAKKLITSEKIVGNTPNGGQYSIATYYDKNGIPCIKKNAARIVIGEYKNDGTFICSTTLLK